MKRPLPLLRATLWCTLFAGLWTAPRTSPAQTGMPRPAEKIAAELCVNCHGPSLTGIPAPNLLDYFWNHGGSDEEVKRSIREGWPQSGMPAFRGILSEEEIEGLLRHLRAQAAEFRQGRIRIPAPPAVMAFRTEKQAFRLETLEDGLETPWGMAFLPDGRLLVTERPGRLRVLRDGKLDPAPIAGLPEVFVKQDGGLLDVAVHPDHAQNGWIYLAYTEKGNEPDTSMTVVVRGRIRDHRWCEQQTLFRADPKFYIPKDTSHYGCRFLFDPAGNLFFTLGDRGRPEEAQDLSSPLGKIHRIAADGSIPADNPFLKTPGALPTVWSYGHRHPQGLAYHPESGRLWETEHGPTGGDELNVLQPAHNYGWPVVSAGTHAERTFAAGREGMDAPAAFWTPSLAPSGIGFYAGERFPGWRNSLFVACLAGQQLRRIETEGDRVTHQEPLFKELGRVRHVLTGPDGMLYLAFNGPDRVARIVPLEEDAPSAAAGSGEAVQREPFGKTGDGRETELFTLRNTHGLVARVTNFGATLCDLQVPDRRGKLGSVVRPIRASAAGFEQGFAQSGAVFGRVANRIAGARFLLDGTEYQLSANTGNNHIHGGFKNFSRVVWTVATPAPESRASVEFRYLSQNGEEGYPGNLQVSVRYTLTEQDALRIEYRASTDRPTPVNLTNHAYFNLAGDGDVLESELTLNADHYTVVDAALLPTGEIRPALGSFLDFTRGAPLGARAEHLGKSRRYDHNFVLNRPPHDHSLGFAARVVEPRSGRILQTWTTEPGLQLYTSPLDAENSPGRFGFFCLETQHFPDSVHHPHFPSTILRPGETFHSVTEFRFSAK